MRSKPTDAILIFALAAVCLAACLLFTFLPYRALDTGLVYTGF